MQPLDPHHLLRTARYCAAAYPPAVRTGQSNGGDPHIVDAEEISDLGSDLLDAWHLPETDTEFYMSSRRGSLMREVSTVGRGTTRLKDWQQNARFHLVTWDHPGHVHEGFRECYDAIRDIVSGRLAATPCHEAGFKGHSLGGGFITLNAIDYAARHPSKLVTLATIGAPRCLDDEAVAFALSLPNLRIYRYHQATLDVVTYIPYLMGSYCHLPGISLPGIGRHSCASYETTARRLAFRFKI